MTVVRSYWVVVVTNEGAGGGQIAGARTSVYLSNKGTELRVVGDGLFVICV